MLTAQLGPEHVEYEEGEIWSINRVRILHYAQVYTLDEIDNLPYHDIASILGVMEGDQAVSQLKDKKPGGATFSSG